MSTLAGKGSWFGGPNDSMDSGHTANGETTKTPGIAVYNHGTLNGYWRVTAPNGKTVVLKQTDIGPAPWTNRKIDVTYSALGKFGYGEHNFPTDSQFKAEYLGKNPGKQPAPRLSSAPSETVSKALPGVTQGFDQAGYQKAQRAALLGKLISSEGGAKDNPLLASGLLSTKAPNRAEYQAETTTPAKLPGVPKAPPQASMGGAQLGGFLPKGAALEYKRLDEGQDVQLKPGQALEASGDFEVVAVKSDPAGFGPRYPVIRFTSGPEQGQVIYFGHGDSLVHAGQKGHAGTPIVRTSTTGHNAPPGWLEIGKGETLGQGNRGQGSAIAPYLRRKR